MAKAKLLKATGVNSIVTALSTMAVGEEVAYYASEPDSLNTGNVLGMNSDEAGIAHRRVVEMEQMNQVMRFHRWESGRGKQKGRYLHVARRVTAGAKKTLEAIGSGTLRVRQKGYA